MAERIQEFRGQELADVDLARPDGSRYALAELDDSALEPLVDLDDPAQLIARSLRPSIVASRSRRVTKPVALVIYEEGGSGFTWWSILEASWTNVTLSAERALLSLRIAGRPEELSVDNRSSGRRPTPWASGWAR